MTTISASRSYGIKLGASDTTPVVIKSGVTITNVGYPNVIYTGSASTTVFAIENAGIVTNESSTIGAGVYLVPGGSATNAASGAIIGHIGIEMLSGPGTVVNDGTVASSDSYNPLSLSPAPGVYLQAGGTVTNGLSASIIGQGGVGIGSASSEASGIVTNDGVIAGGARWDGVGLYAGSTVTNLGKGTITGEIGVDVNADGSTVANAVNNLGKISGSSYGVRVDDGSVTNGSSGYIYGGGWAVAVVDGTVVNNGSITSALSDGVYIVDGGTLVNGGTISGAKNTAVAFGDGNGSSYRLVLDPGFAFAGVVVGSTAAGSTNAIELGSGASAGTVTGLGTEFLHFSSITIEPGAAWSISGIQRGLAGPISGFAHGDTIQLAGVTAAGSSFGGGILTIDQSGGGYVTLNLPGTFTSVNNFNVTNVAAGVDVTVVACFAAGTRILVSAGEVPVEELTVHDRAPTAAGRLTRILWLGHQRTRIPPVRIYAGAFGEHLPTRDLLLSPDHAVFVDGMLVPVRHLINGSTIVQEPAGEVTYHHVELPAHNVIVAEGLPCESYLDTGNRAVFEAGAVLPPDARRQPSDFRPCMDGGARYSATTRKR